MSLTLWQDKKSFNEWRTGEAFKEAHGGGTLFGFVDMLVSLRPKCHHTNQSYLVICRQQVMRFVGTRQVSSTMTLEGPPKPAFWNGLLPLFGNMSDEDKPEASFFPVSCVALGL
eukprot:scaffold375230_cov50-Prasinocladus_malaysianus.AAC.1